MGGSLGWLGTWRGCSSVSPSLVVPGPRQGTYLPGQLHGLHMSHLTHRRPPYNIEAPNAGGRARRHVAARHLWHKFVEVLACLLKAQVRLFAKGGQRASFAVSLSGVITVNRLGVDGIAKPVSGRRSRLQHTLRFYTHIVFFGRLQLDGLEVHGLLHHVLNVSLKEHIALQRGEGKLNEWISKNTLP